MILPTSKATHNTFLDEIIATVPELVRGHSCSLYLIPPLVPEYSGAANLIEGPNRQVGAHTMTADPEDIIVLAATTDHSCEGDLGKKYYRSRESLTGAVFAAAKPLFLARKDDFQELDAATRDFGFKVVWQHKYGTGEAHLPFKAAPLMSPHTPGQAIGVLKVPDSDPTDSDSVALEGSILTSVCRILAFAITHTHLQESIIASLIHLGTLDNECAQHQAIVNLATDLVKASGCTLFTLDSTAENLAPVAVNAPLTPSFARRITDGTAVRYPRGVGLTGWIFNTGLPLNIPNVQTYGRPEHAWYHLSPDELNRVTECKDALIDDTDSWIRWEDLDGEWQERNTNPFLGVPIKDPSGMVYSVPRKLDR